jgi:hypothetical protein
VLEGRQCAPGDALGRPHYPLESPAVAGSAVAVPAQKDALNGASVKMCEGLRGQATFPQPPEVEEAMLHLISSFVLLRERLFSWHQSTRALTSSCRLSHHCW